MQHQYEHAGPSLVERLERRVFKVKQKKKTRVQPLVHRNWHKSLDLLKRGRKNGLILSTRYDIDVENESIIVTFVNKYANDRLTPDISPLKPDPVRDSESVDNRFFDSFSCRILYEKELKRCMKAMKPVYIALYQMKRRALKSAFSIMFKYMLHRRDVMRRAGEDRLANRRAQTHYFFVTTSKHFTAWYDFIILQKERILRLKFVLASRQTNYYKLAFSAWRSRLIEILLKDSEVANKLKEVNSKPERRYFDLWKYHSHQRRTVRKVGFKIEESRMYFIRAAFHIWFSNSLYVLIQNRAYHRLKSRCFRKLVINVLNEYAIFKHTKVAIRKRIRRAKIYRINRWLLYVRFRLQVKESFKHIEDLLLKQKMFSKFSLWRTVTLKRRRIRANVEVRKFNHENWLDRRIRESKEVATGYWTFSESLTKSMRLSSTSLTKRG